MSELFRLLTNHITRCYNKKDIKIIREKGMMKMSEKLPLEGQYLIYKGKPLVREKNVICYGDMTEKCYLFMMILTNKKSGNTEIPDNILVQVLTRGRTPKLSNKEINRAYMTHLISAPYGLNGHWPIRRYKETDGKPSVFC